jgi:protein gp37
MADKSNIEWTDASWNPIAGCSVLSPGCTNCYAMREAGGRLHSTGKFKDLTQPSKAGPVWTGEVRLWEPALDQPLRWQRPRRIFVNSMSDLFHEAVPDEWIDQIFAIMALCPQHTFQVLTKRAERMREYLSPTRAAKVQPHFDQLKIPALKRALDRLMRKYSATPKDVLGVIDDMPKREDPGPFLSQRGVWPLGNLWLIVSVENQPRADERIPHLLATPAAVRGISAEPLLGRVDLSYWLGPNRLLDRPALDWVVAGGESGRGARPMHPDWARSLRDQCLAAGVSYFFKQWGEWAPAPEDMNYAEGAALACRHDHEFEQSSSGHTLIRVGKRAAGRELDGRTWDEYPNPQNA